MNIIQWAEEYLSSNGFTITALPEHVRTMPWSSVTRFITSAGSIYLKQTPPALFLEPVITQILYDRFHASVPIVIATNKELHCFLMKDAGNPLRDLFKSGFQADLLCQSIEKYTFIQHAATEHINIFLELGVPDWRLELLPSLYAELIKKEDILIADGMTTDELNTLYKLRPNFLSLCQKLSDCKLPETLDHCDFHDNNIIIENDTNNITIIDLGETVITHPFFSLITCLRNARFRYSIKETDKTYLQLQDTCFKNRINFKKKNNLLSAFSLAEKLWPIYATLGEYRLMISSHAEEFKSLGRRGRLIEGLKEFIVENKI
jgi:aminoglycoside/choline kinase family phosphotransferase